MKKSIDIVFDDILKFISSELRDSNEINILKKELCFMQPLEPKDIIEYIEDEMSITERKKILKYFSKKMGKQK